MKALELAQHLIEEAAAKGNLEVKLEAYAVGKILHKEYGTISVNPSSVELDTEDNKIMIYGE